jgi:pimeloyl-ACP methyl ester carboxylesterase
VGCDGFIWRYIWEKFGDDFKIIHFNYRGHGHSERAKVPEALKIADFRSDLAAVMDAYEVDKGLIMGHSMGVQVILDYAIQCPERVVGLIPICGSYGNPLDTFHDTDLGSKIFPYIHKVAKFFPRSFQQIWTTVSKSEIAYRVATTAEVNGKVVERADFAPYFQHLSQMDADIFLRAVKSLNEHTVEDMLSGIKIPTLIVAGQHDTFTPAWLSRRMQRLIEASELMIMPGGTHIAPIEIPELLELRLARFVKERVKPLLEADAEVNKKGTAAPKEKRAQSSGTKAKSSRAKPVKKKTAKKTAKTTTTKTSPSTARKRTRATSPATS